MRQSCYFDDFRNYSILYFILCIIVYRQQVEPKGDMENYSQVDCSCSLINVSYKIKNHPQSLHQSRPVPNLSLPKKQPKKTKVSLSRSLSGLNQYQNQTNSRMSETSFIKPTNQQQYRKCNIYTNEQQKPSSILSINAKSNPNSNPQQINTKLKKKYLNPSHYKFGDLEKTKNTTFDNSLEYSQSNKSKVVGSNPQFYETFSFYNRNNPYQSQYKKHLTRNSQVKQMHPQSTKPRSIVIPQNYQMANWSTFPQQVRKIKTLKQLDCRNAQSSGSHGSGTSQNHVSMIISQDTEAHRVGEELRELNRLARKSMGGEERRWGYKTEHCFN